MANTIPAAEVDTIIFACEAGMGSSLMGVSALKKKLKKADLDVTVVHKAARAIPEGSSVIVVHKGLADSVRENHPNAVVIAFNHFLNDPVFDTIVSALKENSNLVQTG